MTPAPSKGGAAARRDRRPERRFAGIEARWQDGRWRWRARQKRAGRAAVGPWRDEQHAAAKDRIAIEERAGAFRAARGRTLGQALEAVTEEARRRGVSERTLVGMFDSHRRYVARVLGADVALAELVDGQRIRAFVVAAARAGRAGNTIWGKDLWIVSRAFRLAGLPDPIPELRREMRANVKRVPAEITFLEAGELRELLQRMRTGAVAAGRRAPPPHVCERDADLVELLAQTGIRAGELGRVRVADVDLRRAKVRVRFAKDRGHPRTLELPATARVLLERIVARAKTAGEQLVLRNGERLVGRRLRCWQTLLSEPRLTARNLRHSYATNLLQAAGATPTEVMDALGHRRMSTTSRYVAAVGVRAKELAEKLATALRGEGNP